MIIDDALYAFENDLSYIEEMLRAAARIVEKQQKPGKPNESNACGVSR